MLTNKYTAIIRRKKMLLFILMIMVFVLGVYFVSIGSNRDITDVYATMIAVVNGKSLTTSQKIIIFLRLPRIVMAIIAGVGFGISGAVMQSVSRNYLVSPFTLGVSSAAAFGAAMAIIFGTGTIFGTEYGLVFCAFFSAVICMMIIFAIARQLGFKPVTVVLIGISLNYFFSALTSMTEFVATQYKLEDIIQWTFGTLNKATWSNIIICFIVVLSCSILLFRYSLAFDIIANNNDETVQSLGVNPIKLRCISTLLAVLMTAAIVSFTGVIGFIGLIAPHMARLLIGNEHRFFMPLAGTIGALLLLVADEIGKFILYPVNIPVGIVVAFLGVPLFVYLILFLNRKEIN